MTLGCNTLLPEGRLTDAAAQFGVAEHIRSLELIKAAGFDAAEFSHIEHLNDAELREIAGAARSLGVTPWSAHSWQAIVSELGDVDHALKEYDAFLHKSELLGVEVVVVHCAGSRVDLDDPRVRAARRDANLSCLEPLAERAARAGVRVAIENGAHRDDWEFIVEMVREFGHPNVGLNVDTGHANLGDMDAPTAVRLAGDRLITTHLQDNFGERDDHLPPGKGRIDWPAVVAALREVGYSGCYMVEISDCPPGREPLAEQDMQTAYRNLSGWLKAK